MAQTVKNLPVMQETWVQSLGQEDLIEKEMAIHSSVHFIISLATRTQERKRGNFLLLKVGEPPDG